ALHAPPELRRYLPPAVPAARLPREPLVRTPPRRRRPVALRLGRPMEARQGPAADPPARHAGGDLWEVRLPPPGAVEAPERRLDGDRRPDGGDREGARRLAPARHGHDRPAGFGLRGGRAAPCRGASREGQALTIAPALRAAGRHGIIG